jgi:hypothetical protein
MSGAQPQPNSGTPGDDKSERTESSSTGNKHTRSENERDRLESENEGVGKLARPIRSRSPGRRHRMHLKCSWHGLNFSSNMFFYVHLRGVIRG